MINEMKTSDPHEVELVDLALPLELVRLDGRVRPLDEQVDILPSAIIA
jgi:hypothetical protein